MKKGKAFLVVGHANWGKSRTLKYLTGGNVHVRNFPIGGNRFLIRRMSNDDYSENFSDYVINLNQEHDQYIIITFCPNIDDRKNETIKLLKILSSKYDLYAFVLKYQYNSENTVADESINLLKNYCNLINIFEMKHADANHRASSLYDFIKNTLINIIN
jgi:hypothetical protein